MNFCGFVRVFFTGCDTGCPPYDPSLPASVAFNMGEEIIIPRVADENRWFVEVDTDEFFELYCAGDNWSLRRLRGEIITTEFTGPVSSGSPLGSYGPVTIYSP
jgi:hypothetical protein